MGEEELGLDNVGHGYAFCDCVFDLEARVHFEEEVLFSGGVDEEFEGAEGEVTDLLSN